MVMDGNYSKKIRILSFQNAHNFGAVLQAYGLQQTILSLGYKDVKFINYNPKYLSDRYNPLTRAHILPGKGSLRSMVRKLVRYPAYLISTVRRNASFRSSIRRLLVQTPTCITNESGLVNEEYDVLVVGSDQIWNTSLTGTFDTVFMGMGPYKKAGYVISYAPSTELSALTDERARELAGLIEPFRHISVRETPIKEKLEKYTAKSIQVCVDPTILCGADAYNRIVAPCPSSKKYILVYAYDPHKESILEMVKTIPNWQEYEVYSVLLGARGLKQLFNKNILSELSIEEFLSYIKHASYVVTNSFHGLAFSLLFEKNFNVDYEPGKHIRCESLMNQINLTSRFVKDLKNIVWDEINYSDVNGRLAEIRNRSKDFLKMALGG